MMRNQIRKRFRAISNVIHDLNADILLLQEVHDYASLYFLRHQLKEFPFRAYHHMLYGPRGGLVIFSKIPFQNRRYYDFIAKGDIYNKSVSGHFSQKGVLSVLLEKSDLWLINTHLTQNSDHDFSDTNRYTPILTSQLKQITVHTAGITNRGEQLILGGDFNMPKLTHFYKDFVEETKLIDCFKDDDFTTYHQSFLPTGASIDRVDYIFTSPEIKTMKTSYFLQQPLKDEKGNNFFASDHIGLVATCRV